MALQPRRIFIDVQNRTFISSPFSNLPSVNPVWVDEDVEVVEIYALRPINDPASPFAFVDLSAATVKFAVGATTPAALQSAFTAIPTTVTTTVTETQTGGSLGGTVDERQRIEFGGATPYSGSYVIKFPQRTISSATVSGTVITANNHGLYPGMSVTLSSPQGTLGFVAGRTYMVQNAAQNSFQLAEIGSTTITGNDSASATVNVIVSEVITPSISYSAPVAAVQQAILDAFGVQQIPQIAVSGENGAVLDIYYGGRNGQAAYPNVVIVNSSLKGAPGVTANVSYNTTEIAALIAAGTTSVTMEIEISEGAVRQTFRQPATLSGDLITSTTPSPLPANVATSYDLQSPDGGVWTVTITDDGELKLAKQ